MPKDWMQLENQEKVDALTKVLTKAGSDLKYRDECLMSPRSARAAVEKEADVILPLGMKVRFMTVDEDEEESLMILKLPEYHDPADGGEMKVEADREHWPCTYTIYDM
jgi:hypothetical protein